jgi:Insertion element 4 transposase N-terminal/Transposase DDE domain
MKTEQGCSTFAADEDGRILDRLKGLEKVIPVESVRQVLQESGRVNGRSCLLSHEVMLWVVLGMGLLTHMPIRQVFKHSRRLRPGERSPCRSSLCEGRKRLGLEPVQRLHELVVHPLARPDVPGGFYRGLRLMGIDATVMDVPDSEANRIFGRSSGSRGEAAFPQIRKASLVELGTHVELAIAFGGWCEGEQKLARQLWDKIPPDALLLEDRGFFSYDDWKALNLRVKLLVRMKSHHVLKPIKRLSDGSYLAKIYATGHDRDKDRHGIVVRVIEYTLNDPQRKGHGEVHRLITNLLDEGEYPGLELILIYHERWEEELVFDEQKTHQDPRRAEKAAQLRSETPAGVQQELYALSLGHFVVRSLMFTAATSRQVDVDRLSFTGCFRILQCRLPECTSRKPAAMQRWFAGLMEEMLGESIEPRRNRINPRVIKRKMSKWNKKGSKHRPVLPLLKTFEECVVMKT